MDRKPFLAVLSAVLAAGVVAGWQSGPGAGYPPASPPGPAAVQRTAADSEWYCSVGTAVTGGQAGGEIVLANAGASTLTGTVEIYGNQGGPSRSRAFSLPPWSRAVLGEQAVLGAPFVAATVVFDGSGGGADQEVVGPLGESVSPCATAPSSDWYFAAGTTQTGASLVTALFNPFPEDALADLSFSDGQGPSAPADFQGVFVPAHSLVTVDVGQHVVQTDDIATTVHARVGRLVASQLQLDAIGGQAGMSLVLGAPGPARRWYLPDGVVASGVSEAVHLYNPTGSQERVSVALDLAKGEAQPFEIPLAPGAESVLELAGQTRVPLNDPYDAVVTSAGGPVVAERTVVAASPSTRTGTAAMMGSLVPSRRWLLVAGGATPGQDEWLDIYDPGTRPAKVEVAYLNQGSLEPVPGLGAVVVPPGGRSALRLGDHIQLADLSIEVDAAVPVVVERDLYEVGSRGISIAIGDPISG